MRTQLTPTEVGQLLGERRVIELRLARGFKECRGMSCDQLEDLFQDTVIALLGRRLETEKHTIDALRRGIKQRALRAHRDRRRHANVLARHAAGIERVRQAAAAESEPERCAIRAAERHAAAKYLSSLSGVERRVFSVCAIEDCGYRNAAYTLGIDVLEARRAARAAAGKRDRCAVLRDSGFLRGPAW